MTAGITSLHGAVAAKAHAAPDHVFLQAVEGGARTYREVHEAGLRWGGAFAAAGVGRGDRVAVMLPTSIELVEAWLGISWVRAIETPINTEYRGRLLEYVLRDCGATILLTNRAHLLHLASTPGALSQVRTVVLIGPDDASTPVPGDIQTVRQTDFLADQGSHDLEEPSPRDIATMLYTSGTTGPSKGVLMHWGQLIATARGGLPLEEYDETDSFYAPFPFYHVAAKASLMAMALAGGGYVMRERFSTSSLLSDIKAHRCTTTLILESMANFIYRRPELPSDRDTPLSKVVMVPLIAEVEDFKRRFGVEVCTNYNMTELSAPIVSQPRWDVGEPRSCGRARPGYELRVVDDDDVPVGPGVVGELAVRASAPWVLMGGYWRNPEATVEAWRNQWLHTGDLFSYDEDGRFYFIDRKKDTIRYRGENISSAEIEAEVLSHPDVQECAAIAVPSEWGEDEVMVLVVLKPERSLTPPLLLDFLEPRVAAFMRPRFIELLAELPKTVTHKVRKVELRARGVTDATWDRRAPQERQE